MSEKEQPKRRPLSASVRGEIRRQAMAPPGWRYGGGNGRKEPGMPVFNLPPIEEDDDGNG